MKNTRIKRLTIEPIRSIDIDNISIDNLTYIEEVCIMCSYHLSSVHIASILKMTLKPGSKLRHLKISNLSISDFKDDEPNSIPLSTEDLRKVAYKLDQDCQVASVLHEALLWSISGDIYLSDCCSRNV